MTLYNRQVDTTPGLAALGTRSAVFDYCMTNGLWTRSAVPSLLTGKLVSHHGQMIGRATGEYFDVLPDHERTIAELFLDGGYRTSLVAAMGWYDQAFGFTQGFQHLSLRPDLHRYQGRAANGASAVPYGLTIRRDDRAALEIALEQANDLRRDARPFFLMIHLTGVHSPLNLDAQHLGRYVTADEYRRYQDKFGASFGFGTNHHRLMADDEEYRDFYSRLYMEVLRYVDGIVTQFVTAYEKLQRNTIFVITADHGEALGERWGEHLHGEYVTPFDEVSRIPLLFYWPGRIAATRVNGPAMLVDILPTVAAMAGLRSGGELDGRSLWGLFGGEEAEFDAESRLCLTEGGFDYLSYAAVSGGYKLVAVYPTSEEASWQINRTGYSEMLFSRDAGEGRNLRFENPQKAAELRALAHEVLLGRKGYHLVARSGQSVHRFSGTVRASGTRVDRTSIRHHGGAPGFDKGLASDPRFNRFSMLAVGGPGVEVMAGGRHPSLTLSGGAAARGSLQLEPDPRRKAGQLLVLSLGFELAMSEGPATVRFTYRAPGIEKAEVLRVRGGSSLSFVNQYVARAGDPITLEFQNLSDTPAGLRNCFLFPTETGPGAVRAANGEVNYAFSLGTGLVDLNWDYERPPEALRIVLDEPAESVYVWQGTRFGKLEPRQLGPEGIHLLEPSSRQEIIRALRSSPEPGAPALFLYRFGEPSNSRYGPSGRELQIDKEVIENLKALGYL